MLNSHRIKRLCPVVGNKMPKQKVMNEIPKEVVKQNRRTNKKAKNQQQAATRTIAVIFRIW